MRSIEIDFDVHKVIENERQGFEESANDALRRLLNLGEPKPQVAAKLTAATATQHTRSWSDKGVTLPHGTKLRMSYSGHSIEGKISDGRWVIGMQAFDSPSGAASGVARTRRGKPTRLDGWNYWFVQLPGDGKWRLIDDLRPAPPATGPIPLAVDVGL